MAESEHQEKRARRLLAEVYKPEGVELWMRHRKRSLNGRTPEAAIRAGDAREVFSLIEQILLADRADDLRGGVVSEHTAPARHGDLGLLWACKCGRTFAAADELHVHLSLHGATTYPLSAEEIAEYEAHRACPYCNYNRDHCAAEWNALTQEARTALVAARLCDG